jgi:hypothetical protein
MHVIFRSMARTLGPSYQPYLLEQDLPPLHFHYVNIIHNID